jgi:hypothetical protein
MRVQGENWENDIYPRLSTVHARCVRALLPERVLTTVASQWLLRSRSALSTPYFQAVALASAEALPAGSCEDFLRGHLRFIVQFYLKMSAMIEGRRETIKQRLRGRLRLRLDGLETALSAGRGVLMPSIQTSVPLRMIFASFPKGGRYNLVLHRQSGDIVKMLEKADPGWTFLFLEDAPARRILAALRRNEAVICNIDHAYPDTEVTLTPVLGRAAVVPSGAFRLAQRCGAQVAPLTFSEENGDAVIVCDHVFQWPEAEAMPIAAMLARVQPVLDRVVLDAPERWLGWGNLLNRWCAWQAYAS